MSHAGFPLILKLMPLNNTEHVMAVILCYFIKFGSFGVINCHSGWS